MPKFDFDITGARKAGASDTDIANYFKTKYNVDFDFAGASKSGASDSDVLNYLNNKYGGSELPKSQQSQFGLAGQQEFKQATTLQPKPEQKPISTDNRIVNFGNDKPVNDNTRIQAPQDAVQREKMFQNVIKTLPALRENVVKNKTLDILQKQGKLPAVGSYDYLALKPQVEANTSEDEYLPEMLRHHETKQELDKKAVTDFSLAQNESPEEIQKNIDAGKYVIQDGKVKEIGGFGANFSQGVRDFVNNIGLAMNVSAAQSEGNNNKVKYVLNQFTNNKKNERETASNEIGGYSGKLLGGLVPYAGAGVLLPGSDIPLMGFSNMGAMNQEIWNDPNKTDEEKINSIKRTNSDAMLTGTLQGIGFHAIGGVGEKQTANSLLKQYAPTSALKKTFTQNLYNDFGDLLKTSPEDVSKAAAIGGGTELLNDLTKKKEGLKVDFSNIAEGALNMAALDLVMKIPKVLTVATGTLKAAKNSGYDKINPDWYNQYNRQTQDALNAIVAAPEKIYNDAVSQLDKSPDPNAAAAKLKIETFRGYYNSLPAELPTEAKSKALHILQLKTEAIDDANNAPEGGIKNYYQQRASAYDGLLNKVLTDGKIDEKKEPLLLPRFAASVPKNEEEIAPENLPDNAKEEKQAEVIQQPQDEGTASGNELVASKESIPATTEVNKVEQPTGKTEHIKENDKGDLDKIQSEGGKYEIGVNAPIFEGDKYRVSVAKLGDVNNGKGVEKGYINSDHLYEEFDTREEANNYIDKILNKDKKPEQVDTPSSTEAKKADIKRRRQEELKDNITLLNTVEQRRPNGSIGTQGFTETSFINLARFISDSLNLNLPAYDKSSTISEISQIINFLKNNEAAKQAVLDYVKSDPIVADILPDDTYHFKDGNHRANLLNLIGVEQLPIISSEKNKEINAKYDAELAGLTTPSSTLVGGGDKASNVGGDVGQTFETGKPITVFHGTTQNFETFDAGKRGSATHDEDTQFGTFFSDTHDEANKYTKGNGRVIKAELNLKNPLVVDVQKIGGNKIELIKKAIADGHDGIVFENILTGKNKETGEWNKHTEYIVFDNDAIKILDHNHTPEQSLSPKQESGVVGSETPIKDEYQSKIDNLDKENKQSDVSKLSEGDYVNVPQSEKSSGVQGFVKKVGRTNVVLDTFYQLGSSADDGIMQEITVKKADIKEFIKPNKSTENTGTESQKTEPIVEDNIPPIPPKGGQKVEDVPPPPVDNPPQSTGGGSNISKMRSLQKNLINRSTGLTADQKRIAMVDTDSMYSVLPRETSRKIAKAIIDEIGVDNAVKLAETKGNELSESERVMLLGAAMNHYAGEAKLAAKKGDLPGEKENADYELLMDEKFANAVKSLGKLGTQYGQAINAFRDVYQLSNIALARKLEKRVAKLNELRAKDADKDVEGVVEILQNEQKQLEGAGDAMTENEATLGADSKATIAALEKEVADLKKQVQENTGKFKGTKSNPLNITRKTNDTDYDKRLKEFKSRHRTGLNKDDLSDLTYFGLYHVENGITKFTDWYNAMSSKFGKFKEHLPALYEKVKEDAVKEGVDKTLFDNGDVVSNFFNSAKTAREYRTLETERNRQLEKVEQLKTKLADLEKDGLPVKEDTVPEMDTPEIESLKQKVKDLEGSLRKKESDAKNTKTNIEKLNQELTRIRERRAKEKNEKKPASKEFSDAEKDIIAQIKAENEKWGKEKQSAEQAKKAYAAMETERNRQIEKEAKLNEKLSTLKSGKRPETKTSTPKVDTPAIEKLKADIKAESEKLSAIESQQKRVDDLETELQRLKDRKPKEKDDKTEREASDREKELKAQIAEEKKKINEEWKASPEYQAESDAKKMAQITKRQAIAGLNQAMGNNPERARALAPRYAAKRIRQDAAKNLDMPTTKNEQTYLQRLVNVVSNKAKEYYKGKGEKVVGNDILQFAIANGKKGDKLWKGTQDEVNRQIDADIKLSDSEKAEVKDFLDEYIDSTFETLLTEPQKSKIIRDKLIEAGLSKDMVVNGETKKVVDWNKIIGNKKSIQDAKDAITKAVTDLGYTPEEAKNELNALLGSLDKVITDKLTKDTNAFLNKSIIDKAKGMFGKGVGKSKIQKLVDLRNKGTLDVKEARSVLSKHLGIHEVSAEDYAKVKDLLDKIDTPDLPPFVRKKFEEEVQYIFDKYGGNIGYLKHRDFGLSNALSSPVNAVQNLTGITRVPSKAIVTALKTGDFRTVAKIAINEMVKAKSTANTVLHGDVSRGTSYDEFTMDIEGNPRVRYNEYGESHLLGLPDAYVNVGGGKTVNANLLNAGMRATSRSVGRSLEATDTFSSNPIAALQIYEDIKANTKLLHPELSNKEISRRAYEMMYGEDLAVEKSKAKKAMEAAGLTPTKSQLNRAAYEAVERKINDKLSKEFYDKIEKTLPVAKERLENRGVKDPTEKQIKEEAYLMVGADAPLDAVASGEREAQRLTGKNTSPGITWLVLKPFEYMANGVKKSVTKEHSLVGKSITNAADAALQITFPYASSIGRWIEFGFELTPYGMGKGLAYKAFKSNIARLEKIPEAEVSRMGTDYMLRSIQGAAQTVAAFGLLSMLNNEEDKDKLVTGTYKEENYNKEKVAQVGSPKRSFKLGGHNIPIDLLGTQAIPMIMWQDLQDRMKDPSYDEKHDLLYMSAAVYMEAASQAYLSFDQKYGGMLSKVQTGKDNSASLGKIAGQIIGKYTIPFNRTQADIAQLANPLSEQSVDFGTNVLEQMSITKALGTDKPNYDYRGRTVDIGDIYAMSADGFRKMFEKPKYGDGIDKFLAKIDFAATDAYRESGLSKKATYRIYDKDQDIPRDMTPDEYYEFQYETGKAFDKSLKLLAPEIEKIEPLKDKKGNDDYAETKKFQNTLLSQALTDAKKEAITKVQEKTGYVPNEYELMIDKAIGDIDNDIKKALIKMKIDILKMNGKK